MDKLNSKGVNELTKCHNVAKWQDYDLTYNMINSHKIWDKRLASRQPTLWRRSFLSSVTLHLHETVASGRLLSDNCLREEKKVTN